MNEVCPSEITNQQSAIGIHFLVAAIGTMNRSVLSITILCGLLSATVASSLRANDVSPATRTLLAKFCTDCHGAADDGPVLQANGFVFHGLAIRRPRRPKNSITTKSSS